MTAGILFTAAAAEAPMPESRQETAEISEGILNRVDSFEISLTAEMELVDNASYEFALHNRQEGYDPASVLISGILFVPAGVEIQKATVTASGGPAYEISGSDILRMKNSFVPGSVAGLQFEPDRDRSGFAFLVDMSREDIPDGAAEVRVTLTTDRDLSLTTTVNIDKKQGQYYDVGQAVRGQCRVLNDMGKQVEALQSRLCQLGYLTEEEITSTCDSRTIDAANELLRKYHIEQRSGYLSSEAVGFIESDQPEAKTAGIMDHLLDFFGGSVMIGSRGIQVWMLTAAGAALLLLILLIILLVSGKKRKMKRKMRESAENDPIDQQGKNSAQGNGEIGQILTIGDEPTMDLSESMAAEIASFEDEPTAELDTSGCTLRIRMIYSDQYLDKEILLQDGDRAVIGRSEDTDICTNPQDGSVSHRHGIITFSGGRISYTDSSRNGTLFDGRVLHNGEAADIPFNAKIQLEVGKHKVLVFAVKTQCQHAPG